jgi:hypothetical protein
MLQKRPGFPGAFFSLPRVIHAQKRIAGLQKAALL